MSTLPLPLFGGKPYTALLELLNGFSDVLHEGSADFLVEIEARYRPKKGAAVSFERVLKRARELNLTESFEQSTDHIYVNHLRQRIINGKGGNEVVWMNKYVHEDETGTYLYSSKSVEGVILRASIEETVPEPRDVASLEKKEIRDKSRYSFILLSGIARLDLTKVITTEFTSETSTSSLPHAVSRERFEIELEYTADIGQMSIVELRDSLTKFIIQIDEVYKWVYDTENIYTLGEKEALIVSVNNIIGSAGSTDIDSSRLVKARNLRFPDMRWGGVVGGSRGYTVSVKVDGQRKMLVIGMIGIWLVYPPYEYNLIWRFSVDQSREFGAVKGTILDGELVTPRSNRHDKEVTAAYWYIPFDALADKGQNVMNKYHPDRLAVAGKIGNIFNNPKEHLFVSNKSYHDVHTRDLFFQRVRELLFTRPSTFTFETDGLIFTPIRASYINPTMGVPLNKRTLVELPEVCKWKPPEKITIDFRIKWEATPNGGKRIVLQSVVSKGAEGHTFEPFLGDALHPFKGEVEENDVTKDLNTGSIVECVWVATDAEEGTGRFLPLKARSDKLFPNNLEQALDNWVLLHNPITREDMIGETLTLMFKYHNRLKSTLYQQIAEGSLILDIGFGAGGDLNKYPHNSQVLGIDTNLEHLAEARRRIALRKQEKHIVAIEADGTDGTTISRALDAHFQGRKADAVVLMHSLTFFWKDKNTLDSLVRSIVTNLKPEGKILFITLDGNAIDEAFNPTLLPHTAKEISLKLGKATIDYDYQQKVPPNSGKVLEITLPGSRTVEGKQKEYIVYISDLLSRLKEYGYELGSEIKQADDCSFLTIGGETLSRLYCYGWLKGAKKSMPQSIVTPTVTTPTVKRPIILPPPISLAKKPVRISSIGRGISLLSVTPSRDENDPAQGDDLSTPLKCNWYPLPEDGEGRQTERVMRIATIGDGNCFIHAVLKATYIPYQENGSYAFRVLMARKVRRDLALRLSSLEPTLSQLHPDHRHTYWEVTSKGQFVTLLIKEILSPELLEGEDAFPDCSLKGLQMLFNSDAYLGEPVYKFIAQALGLDLYVLIGTVDNCYIGSTTYDPLEPSRPSICIVGNTQHYEVVAVERGGLLQTVFTDDDPFINALKSRASRGGQAFPPRTPIASDIEEVDQRTLDAIYLALEGYPDQTATLQELFARLPWLPPTEPLIPILQRYREEGQLTV